MHVRRADTYIEVLTPAKINLFLEVIGKRPDGYHEIETLMTAVTIYDTLLLFPRGDNTIDLECRWTHGLAAADQARQPLSDAREKRFGVIPEGSQNIVWQALELLRGQAGCKQGATVRLVKRIPAAAGLGGASSDAAAALVAANLGWRLGWPVERLMGLAAQLGSDVPFFLSPGVAVCRGRGEQIVRLPPRRLHTVVVRPPVGLSTPDVYRACRITATPVGAASFSRSLARGDIAAAGRGLVNNLQQPSASLTLWIDRLATEFGRLDVLGHQMSGSGSSYFGLFRHARHAHRAASRLRARNIGSVFAAATAFAPERQSEWTDERG
jgi:4-diphosphocytidyl-2-C-methyl-D-erythritol kinase